jgi:hypothetical protein
MLHRNCPLRHIIERKIEWTTAEEEDVSSYWMTEKTLEK